MNMLHEKLTAARAIPLDDNVEIYLYWPKGEPVPDDFAVAQAQLGQPHGHWSILIRRVR